MIGEGHFDEGLIGHVALVGLDLDSLQQGGGHAQRNRFGGEFEVGHRDALGPSEVEVDGAVGGFGGNLEGGGFPSSHGISFRGCSYVGRR